MNSRLAARDVDGGAYCCTGKAHHLARRLRAEPEVGGYACGPPPRVGSLCSLSTGPYFRPDYYATAGFDRVPPNGTIQPPRSCKSVK